MKIKVFPKLALRGGKHSVFTPRWGNEKRNDARRRQDGDHETGRVAAQGAGGLGGLEEGRGLACRGSTPTQFQRGVWPPAAGQRALSLGNSATGSLGFAGSGNQRPRGVCCEGLLTSGRANRKIHNPWEVSGTPAPRLAPFCICVQSPPVQWFFFAHVEKDGL